MPTSSPVETKHIRPYKTTTVYCRAVVEITNHCSRNCAYCGMRASNRTLSRYRLSTESIKSAASRAAADGIKILMLQGGDDLQYDIDELCDVVANVRASFEDVILCLGERPVGDYVRLNAAGANQAIIKFETSNRKLYRQMRPHSTLEKRLALLNELAAIGFEMSSGFIIGLPGASDVDEHRNIELLKGLPLFAGSVSPFIPSDQSPLRDAPRPQLEAALQIIEQMRTSGPDLMIPAVSALNLLDGGSEFAGQGAALERGANELTLNYTAPGDRRGFVIYTTNRSIIELDRAARLVERLGKTLDIGTR